MMLSLQDVYDAFFAIYCHAIRSLLPELLNVHISLWCCELCELRRLEYKKTYPTMRPTTKPTAESTMQALPACFRKAAADVLGSHDCPCKTRHRHEHACITKTSRRASSCWPRCKSLHKHKHANASRIQARTQQKPPLWRLP